MASSSTITQLVGYYTNLLIIQYHNQPKAQAHINLIITQLIACAVFLDVLNGYDVNTAVGKQLDVLGKYAGVTRYYNQINLVNYFGFVTYNESLPSSPPQFGFSTYANFSGFQFNGTLTYESIIETQNALADNDFRMLIKLAIITNTCGMGHSEIDAKIYNLFGNQIRMESFGQMVMFYFITTAITPLIAAIIRNKILPKPMGVLRTLVQQTGGDIFGFITYSNIVQPFEYGFTTYANYATTAGQCLTYNQIIQG